MAGRLACDHGGYLCQVPVNSTASTVWRLLEPVGDLLRATTLDEQQQQPPQPSTLSTRMSEFANQLVLTVSRAATTDRHAAAVFSERELKFMFAICRRPSVCLSVVCRLSVCL